MNIARLSMPILAIGLLGLSINAASADTKIFSAAICKDNLVGFTITHPTGALRNSVPLIQSTVHCPLVRDNPAAKPIKIEVSVVDNSTIVLPLLSRGNVLCRAVLVNRFGTAASYGASRSTSGVNSAGTILNLPIPPAVVPDGSLVVQCTIPGRNLLDAPSAIGSIKLTD